jgi:hypothetical protein
MDLYEAITATISFVALIGLLVSLYHYSRQTRASAQAQFQASFISVANAFLAYPHLRPLFYANTASTLTLTDEDTQRGETIAELLLDIFDLILQLEKRFDASELAAGWKPYMSELLRTSGFLQNYLKRRIAWYSSLQAFLPKSALL